MGAAEYARYVLACPQCRATGAAEWWESNDPAYLRRPSWGSRVSAAFERVPALAISGPGFGTPIRSPFPPACRIRQTMDRPT